MTKTQIKRLAHAILLLTLCGAGSIASAADDAAAAAPAPAVPAVLASADGQDAGVRVEITKLKRSSGDTVTLNYVLVNDTDADLNTYALMTAVDTHSSDGVALIDAAGKKKYLVVRDSDNHCLCSANIRDLKPKTRVNLWAKFPAPPANVQTVTVDIPHFQPMDDVPLGQ
jgi:hypothetical protein